MPNIDERLLAASGADRQRQQEMAYDDQLRQERLGTADKERQADSEPQSLRQRIQAARQAMDLKAKAKQKLEEKVTAPAKAGTSNALRWAWLTLIPSFGLSLIYINIHVFLRMVVGEKLFCKLGEEWIPKPLAGAGGEAGKGLSKSIGIIEVMGLLFLDLVAFIIILTALGLVVMIMGWIKHPLDAIAQLGWGAISVLKSLFSMLL